MKLSATILLATFAPAVWAVAFPQITDEANPDGGPGATTTTAGDGSFGEEALTTRDGQFGGIEASTTAPDLGLNPTPTATEAATTIASNESGAILSCNDARYEKYVTPNGRSFYTPYEPFCLPKNGTEWKAETSGFQYITWNPGHFKPNDTIIVSLNYLMSDINPKIGDSQNIWRSTPASNSKGFIEFKPFQDLLHFNDTDHESVTMYFMIESEGPQGIAHDGPYITILSSKEPEPEPIPSHRPVDTKAIAIAVPLAIVGAIAFVLAMHFTMRRERHIGPIHIGGGRAQLRNRFGGGYAQRKSRAERLGGKGQRLQSEPRTESGDWELSNVKAPTEQTRTYRDPEEPQSPFSDAHEVRSPFRDEPSSPPTAMSPRYERRFSRD